MKLPKPLMCAAITWMSILTSHADRLSQCDAYYEERIQPEMANDAYNCYSNIVETAENAVKALESPDSATADPKVLAAALTERARVRKFVLPKVLQTAVWIVQTHRADEGLKDPTGWKEVRVKYINKSIPQTETLVNELPDLAAGYYWRGIYVPFDCGELGIGTKASLRCIFGRIQQVEPDLKKALAINPDIHGAGPERTLGYTHMFKARYSQSDNETALIWAKAAQKRAPRCTMNSMLVAQLQALLGNREVAREMYQAILKLNPRDPAEVDPEYSQEAVLDQGKARVALEKL